MDTAIGEARRVSDAAAGGGSPPPTTCQSVGEQGWTGLAAALWRCQRQPAQLRHASLASRASQCSNGTKVEEIRLNARGRGRDLSAVTSRREVRNSLHGVLCDLLCPAGTPDTVVDGDSSEWLCGPDCRGRAFCPLLELPCKKQTKGPPGGSHGKCSLYSGGIGVTTACRSLETLYVNLSPFVSPDDE